MQNIENGGNMATITSFDEWFDQGEPEGFEEVYSLYRCVVDESDFGSYKCTENKGKLFVKFSFNEDVLMIASQKAKDD